MSHSELPPERLEDIVARWHHAGSFVNAYSLAATLQPNRATARNAEHNDLTSRLRHGQGSPGVDREVADATCHRAAPRRRDNRLRRARPDRPLAGRDANRSADASPDPTSAQGLPSPADTPGSGTPSPSIGPSATSVATAITSASPTPPIATPSTSSTPISKL